MSDQVHHLALVFPPRLARLTRRRGLLALIARVARVARVALIAASGDAIVALQDTIDREQRRAQQRLALLFHQRRPDITLIEPVSSSIETKMVPFAVPGRCRTVTMPHARASVPC